MIKVAKSNFIAGSKKLYYSDSDFLSFSKIYFYEKIIFATLILLFYSKFAAFFSMNYPTRIYENPQYLHKLQIILYDLALLKNIESPIK